MRNTFVAAVVAAIATTPAFASTISTLGDENSSIASWGLVNTAAYGQTFNVLDATTLDNVTFRIDDRGTSIGYDLYV